MKTSYNVVNGVLIKQRINTKTGELKNETTLFTPQDNDFKLLKAWASDFLNKYYYHNKYDIRTEQINKTSMLAYAITSKGKITKAVAKCRKTDKFSYTVGRAIAVSKLLNIPLPSFI